MLSRFCYSEQFDAFATKEFGGYRGGTKVAALAEWGWVSVSL